MKIRIYVLCHDNTTFLAASEEYQSKCWAKPIMIPTTHLLENIMYDKWLLDHEDDWKYCDYVGTISWKASKKINIRELNELLYIIEKFDEMQSFDIVPFLLTNYNLIEQATTHHPKFKNLWINLIRNLKITQETALDNSIKPFFCNYWMCKPKWMYDYIEFFQSAKYVLDNCEEMQHDLWSDSLYTKNIKTLSEEKCMLLYNKPYIPYHVFLYERLPCLFFWLKKANMFKRFTVL
jgi:hypothetical protein